VVGPGGILIEPGFQLTSPGGQDVWAADIPAFSAAIEELYRDPKRRKLLGVLGMEHVRNTFNWDVEAAKFHAILQEATGIYERVEATA
jgi:glycosyltransferase involved in cell wall biosynthesis